MDGHLEVNSVERDVPVELECPDGKNAQVTIARPAEGEQTRDNVLDANAEPWSAQSQLNRALLSQAWKLNVPLPKKLLILDVNGLLVARYSKIDRSVIPMDAPHGVVSKSYMFKRPFCDSFLAFCFENFDVGLWSSMVQANVFRALDFICQGWQDKCRFVMHQGDCTNTGLKNPEKKKQPLFLKELMNVWSKFPQFNETNTLLVDDTPYKALRNPPHTAIFPEAYLYNEADIFLKGPLVEYLTQLRDAVDVREFVRAHPIGLPALGPGSLHWDFFQQVLKTKAKNVSPLHNTQPLVTRVPQATPTGWDCAETVLPPVAPTRWDFAEAVAPPATPSRWDFAETIVPQAASTRWDFAETGAAPSRRDFAETIGSRAAPTRWDFAETGARPAAPSRRDFAETIGSRAAPTRWDFAETRAPPAAPSRRDFAETIGSRAAPTRWDFAETGARPAAPSRRDFAETIGSRAAPTRWDFAETRAPPATPSRRDFAETIGPQAAPTRLDFAETGALPVTPSRRDFAETIGSRAAPTRRDFAETIVPQAAPTGWDFAETGAPPAAPTGWDLAETVVPQAAPTRWDFAGTGAPQATPTGWDFAETGAPQTAPTRWDFAERENELGEPLPPGTY